MSLSHIAIPTKDLKTQRVAQFDQGGVKAMPATCSAHLPPVLIASTIDMIQSEKLQLGFATTLAMGAIMSENFNFDSSLIYLRCVQFPLWVSSIPRPGVDSVPFSVICFIPALFLIAVTAKGLAVNRRTLAAPSTNATRNTSLLSRLLCTDCRQGTDGTLCCSWLAWASPATTTKTRCTPLRIFP